METTDKNPLKKLKLPVEEAARVFMQYAGQKVTFTGRYTGDCEPISYYQVGLDGFLTLDTENVNDSLPIKQCRILLKPLERIYVQDAEQILKYMNAYPTFSANFTEEEKSKTILSVAKGILHATSLMYLPAIIIDFLRSKGYALPYMQWSVDELVGAGIYKLQNSSK